jgi:uncharacterized membrane protein
MNKIKVVLLSAIVILVIVISVLLITNPQQTQNNLDDASFEELFSENNFPDSLSENEVINDYVDLGELFD